MKPLRFLSIAALLFSAFTAGAATPAITAKPEKKAPEKSQETHQDLIAKAQNLTLQRDRLQASQVLIRGIHREPKGSAAAKELLRALEDLTGVFYTDKAQTLFAAGEAQPEDKARDAVEQFQEALRLEDSNLTVMKALARTYLRLKECGKADAIVTSSEAIHPYSAEVTLLRLQTLDCLGRHEALATRLTQLVAASKDPEIAAVEKFTRGLQAAELLRKNDMKKAKGLVAAWEVQSPEYPEVHFWKWKLSKDSGAPDRTAAVKYVRLCQNLTPRRRKSYNLDVDLCKEKQAADNYIKESSLQSSPPAGESAR